MNGLIALMNSRVVRHGLALTALLPCLVFANLVQAFQLQSMDKQRVNLMDYVADGKWTVVMFWATDCIPCEEQKPALEAFHQRHNANAATVVGIAIDGMQMKAEIDALNNLHDPSYPNLVVYTDVFARQYKELVGKPFRTTPTFLVFDAQGSLQGNIYGYMDFNALTQHIAANNQ